MTIHGGDIYRNKVNMDFSVNISPYGVPPMVRAAMYEAMADVSTYPDPLYEELKTAIGKSDNTPTDSIICGNGASELIYASLNAIYKKLSSKDSCVSMLVPCFLGYEKAVKASGFRSINKIYLYEENDFIPQDDDIDKLIKNSAAVIIGNPNNPTGRLLKKEWLNALIKKAENSGTYVIIDEAFIALTEHSEDYDIHSQNVIRIRAYTKSMAIPGLRLGYLICENKEIINDIGELLPEWNVSVIAARAGVKCAEAKEWLRARVNDDENGIKALRDRLKDKLTDKGLKVFDSDTNYLLIKSDVNLYDDLLEKGILIRDCENFDGLEKGFYRIAVKNHEDNDLLEVKPADIEKKSFEILTSELEAKGIYLTGDTASVIKRCIHTTADFQYAVTLKFSENAIAKMKELIRNGACIVTDTNMALSGINKTELSKYGGEAFCFMADPSIAAIAKERGCTRATASMEHASRLDKKVIFVIGNAPTALVTLCEMMDRNEFTPEFVIGVPVGFVNVEQAKNMVMDRDINYIVNAGRKGGSNVAAAIVNAVLYQMRDE